MGKTSKVCVVLACILETAFNNSPAIAFDTGAAFLRIPVGARPAAMGGAYTAALDDINSLYYNPSGLSTLKQKQVSLTHANWIGDASFDFLGAAIPTSHGTIGFGVTRLATAIPDGRDESRQAASGFQNSDTAYAISFSHPVPASLLGSGATYLGTNFKLLESRIGPFVARSYAMDVGLLQTFQNSPVSFGASILNLGRGMTYLSQTDALPLTAAAGAAYRFGALRVEFDAARDVYDRKWDFRIGDEYALLPSFSLRMGYATAQMNRTGSAGGIGNFAGLAAGFGLRLGRANVDYTFSPMAQLGDVQRVSLGARF